MNKITAIIITKNEEKTIKDCIKSLTFVDKILVVDSYSEDKTTDIAQKLGAEVIKHTFINFSQMRNFALSKINTEWILFIDADERVSEELQKEMIKAINLKITATAFSFTRKNYYLNKEWPYKETVTKLFLKEKFYGYKGELHESPVFDGEVKRIRGELLHFTHRSLEEMMDKTVQWSEIEAKLRYQSGHPKVTWWRLIRVFLTGFFNSYIMQKGYLAGTVGFIESYYQGFSMFITYARLWEMQKRK